MIKVTVKLDKVLEEVKKSSYWLARETKKAQSTIANLVKNKTRGIDFDTLELIIEVIKPLKPDLKITDIIDYEQK